MWRRGKEVEIDSQVVEEGKGKRVKGVWWREASYLGILGLEVHG